MILTICIKCQATTFRHKEIHSLKVREVHKEYRNKNLTPDYELPVNTRIKQGSTIVAHIARPSHTHSPGTETYIVRDATISMTHEWLAPSAVRSPAHHLSNKATPVWSHTSRILSSTLSSPTQSLQAMDSTSRITCKRAWSPHRACETHPSEASTKTGMAISHNPVQMWAGHNDCKQVFCQATLKVRSELDSVRQKLLTKSIILRTIKHWIYRILLPYIRKDLRMGPCQIESLLPRRGIMTEVLTWSDTQLIRRFSKK